MSKRKAEAPAGRSGKAKAAPDEDEQDLVGSAKDDGEDEDDGLDAALGGDDDEDDLADVLGGDDDEDDLVGDDDVPPFDATEIGELPDGLEESQLTDEEDVDLSKIELTVPQARRVAQLLAQNGSLSKIKCQRIRSPSATSRKTSSSGIQKSTTTSKRYASSVGPPTLCAALAPACARPAPACIRVRARPGPLRDLSGAHRALSDASADHHC